MRRTLPQIIMLNHFAWVEQKRSDARVDARAKYNEDHESQLDKDPIDEKWGKRMSEITSNGSLLNAYLMDWGEWGA